MRTTKESAFVCKLVLLDRLDKALLVEYLTVAAAPLKLIFKVEHKLEVGSDFDLERVELLMLRRPFGSLTTNPEQNNKKRESRLIQRSETYPRIPGKTLTVKLHTLYLAWLMP